jgi:hypothetical protein
MAREEGLMGLPDSSVIKIVFARSGNRCAYFDCYAPLVEENDVVTGQVCHIKARSELGPRYDPTQTDKERNAPANLILLCARHHKIVDELPATYTVEVLHALKRERELQGDVAITPEIARRAELLRSQFIIHVQGDLSVSTIHAQHVTFKGARHTKATIATPVDVVGGSSSHRAYLKHLITRYQEFAKTQKGREYKFAVIYKSIQREFKTDWDWIPLSRFHEAVRFVQTRIDGTIVGRQRKKRGMASYEDFDSYLANQR